MKLISTLILGLTILSCDSSETEESAPLAPLMASEEAEITHQVF